MACGVPTIASNSSCIPEISGGALQYFDAYSIEEMAERIHHALSDTDLRRELRTRGLERASVFSWRRCAEETLRVLAKAA
jgi:glycosyltransferase involved in cell wall biosynthesis